MPLVSTSLISIWIPTKNYEQSLKQSTQAPTTTEHGINLVEDTNCEEIVQEVLTFLDPSQTTFQTSQCGNFKLVQFSVQSEDVESTLIKLQRYGIGNREHTSISVFPASIHLEHRVRPVPGDDEIKDYDTDVEATKFEKAVNDFYSSVKSRLLVAEVIARIRDGSRFTFDYLALLLLAATISFFGLTENSSVVLVASMLVSPIMGPILAGVFGTVIQDKPLRNYGVKIETLSLVICILMGFSLGLLYSPMVDSYGLDQWPTTEMTSRGRPRNLVVGILIAIPSGAGIALSVLGGNSGSLVGVAISASLLPPAVNAGCLWALAIVSALRNPNEVIIGWSFNQTLADSTEELTFFPPLVNNAQSWPFQMFLLGLVSLTLTVANIVCIIVTGILILKIKEVTPEKIPQKFSEFWKRDIRAHREYYKTVKPGETLLDEARQVLGIDSSNQDGLEGTFLQQVFDQAQHESDFINIRKWIAISPVQETNSASNSPNSIILQPPRYPPTSQISFSGLSDASGYRATWGPNQPNIAKLIKLSSSQETRRDSWNNRPIYMKMKSLDTRLLDKEDKEGKEK